MKDIFRVLHTSDWHLGRALCGRRRYDEFAAFLNWLAETIEREEVEGLLVAGDVFDVGAPSARAQGLYYSFLGRLAQSRTLMGAAVIAGNHDSPLFLNAPAEILKTLNIHVVGVPSADPADEIVTLKDKAGVARLIVAAVPYPRDRDLRESAAGESAAIKERKLIAAIAAHYAGAAKAAMKAAAEHRVPPPVAAMGHLFAAGGRLADDDFVGDLNVGSLERVPADVFPAVFDYVALGHLHLPQVVGGDDTRRYSGSPLAMTFGEAGRPKSVTLIDFSGPGQKPKTRTLEVPAFQRLARAHGSWAEIEAKIREMDRDESTWLEVEYTGREVIGDLRERLWELTEGSAIEILKVRNQRLAAGVLEGLALGESLADLDEHEVFKRCLDQNGITVEERPGLLEAYGEIIKDMREGDGELS